MTPDEFHAFVLDRLDAIFVLAVAFSTVTLLLLTFAVVSGLGRR